MVWHILFVAHLEAIFIRNRDVSTHKPYIRSRMTYSWGTWKPGNTEPCLSCQMSWAEAFLYFPALSLFLYFSHEPINIQAVHDQTNKI